MEMQAEKAHKEMIIGSSAKFVPNIVEIGLAKI